MKQGSLWSFLLVFIAAWTLLPQAWGQSDITHQRLFDTVPFMQEHYARRVEQFAREPQSQGRIVFLGNSITEIGNWKELTGDSTVLNRGIGGDITYGVLQRIAQVTALRPSKVFLLIGINDIGKDIPPAMIVHNIGQIVNRIRQESPSTRIILQTILPVNPDVKGFPQHYDKNDKVIQANALLRKLAAEKGLPLVDLYAAFSDQQGYLRKELTGDGLHLTPNGDGYRQWVALLRKQGLL